MFPNYLRNFYCCKYGCFCYCLFMTILFSVSVSTCRSPTRSTTTFLIVPVNTAPALYSVVTGVPVSRPISSFVKFINESNCLWYFCFSDFLIIYVQSANAACAKLFLACFFELEAELNFSSRRDFLCRSYIVKFAIVVVAIC